MMSNNLFIMDFETNGLNVFDGKDIPIEIGVIVADNMLNFQESYTALIMPDSSYRTRVVWTGDEVYAYNIHKIEVEEWINKSISYQSCKEHLVALANKYTKVDHNGKKVKPIIISDNAVFETACIRQVFGNDDYRDVFHYSTWDSNVLLEHVVGDPIPAHRALKDCGLLYRNLVCAYNNLNWI